MVAVARGVAKREVAGVEGRGHLERLAVGGDVDPVALGHAPDGGDHQNAADRVGVVVERVHDLGAVGAGTELVVVGVRLGVFEGRLVGLVGVVRVLVRLGLDLVPVVEPQLLVEVEHPAVSRIVEHQRAAVDAKDRPYQRLGSAGDRHRLGLALTAGSHDGGGGARPGAEVAAGQAHRCGRSGADARGELCRQAVGQPDAQQAFGQGEQHAGGVRAALLQLAGDGSGDLFGASVGQDHRAQRLVVHDGLSADRRQLHGVDRGVEPTLHRLGEAPVLHGDGERRAVHGRHVHRAVHPDGDGDALPGGAGRWLTDVGQGGQHRVESLDVGGAQLGVVASGPHLAGGRIDRRDGAAAQVDHRAGLEVDRLVGVVGDGAGVDRHQGTTGGVILDGRTAVLQHVEFLGGRRTGQVEKGVQTDRRLVDAAIRLLGVVGDPDARIVEVELVHRVADRPHRKGDDQAQHQGCDQPWCPAHDRPLAHVVTGPPG